jgi:hypothetical protein
MNKTKTLALGILSVMLISLDWWFISTALYQGKPLQFWLFAVGASLLWIAVFSLFVLTNYSTVLLAVVNAASLATYIWFMPKDLYVLMGGIVFFLFSFLFRNRIKSLEKNQSHFSLRQIVGGSVIVLTYALLLLIGFNLYYNTSQDFKDNPEKFYDQMGDVAAKSLPFFSKGLFDNIDANSTLDEYLLNQVQKNNPETFENSVQREKTLNEARKQFLSGVSASGDDLFVQVLAKVVTARVKESVKPYEKFFPLIFTLAIVGLLRTFAFIFNYLAIFVSWLLFKILSALNFFKIVKVQVEVDKLEV